MRDHRYVTFSPFYPQITQFYRIKGGGGSGRPPPPPPRQFLNGKTYPQQTIYRWKGNLTANKTHFKYWKNSLISRFYEQFSRNGSTMAPERLLEKISNFLIIKILYIRLKHVVWRFRIYNYFLENISKTDFAKFLNVFIKSRNLNIPEKC